ncbi:MAG: MarR family transcriptional regulator [Candidatus Marinimicrobia bacterium]|nr:MarR family transcriptional regulator [Candidatus Neomarinimicrobiota bacterium]
MPTHYKGTEREKRALNAWIKFSRAGITLSSRLSESLRTFKLTESQFAVVEAVYHLGPMNLSEICGKLLCTGGNLTTVVDNLEKQKLAKRIPGKTDRRQYEIHLTQKGRKHIEKLFPAHVQRIVREFSVLSAAEQEEFSRLCKKLGLGIANHNK